MRTTSHPIEETTTQRRDVGSDAVDVGGHPGAKEVAEAVDNPLVVAVVEGQEHGVVHIAAAVVEGQTRDEALADRGPY